jgi:MFS family permease
MSNSPPARSGHQASAVLAFLYLGYLLSFADRVIFGMVLKPIKATLGLSDSQLGLLAGLAFALSYALFSPLAGWFVDRQPRKHLMAAAISFWSAMTLATGFAGSFLTMGLARLGVGAGEAFLHPLSVSLVSDTVEPQRRARAFAVYLSAGALGSSVALLFGGLLIRRLLKLGHITLPLLGAVQPWQGLFVAAAVPGLLLALMVVAVMREPPRLGATHAAGGEQGSAMAFLKANRRLCWAIFGGISFLQMAAYTMTTWKITFFERVHGWSGAEAGIWLGAVGGVASLVGCLAGARLIGWLRGRGYADAPLRLCVASGVCYAVFSILGLLAPTPQLAMALFVGSLFWSYVPSVAGFTAMGEILPADVRARLAGLHTFANGLISNSLGPFLVGLFSDRLFPQVTGIRYAMVATVVIAAVLGLASVVWGLGPYRRRFATETPDALLSPADDAAVAAA